MKEVNKMKPVKFTYQLKTISNVILSPREHQAFYENVDFNSSLIKLKNIDKKSKINIIYPFYQYGLYETYDPKKAQYYIPGSSLKGAFSIQEKLKHTFMFDDILIENSKISLQQLQKVQNINLQEQKHEKIQEQKQIMIDTYFQNLAIEMLNQNETLQGDMYCQNDIIDTILAEINEKTITKIDQFHTMIQNVLALKKDREFDENCENRLQKLQTNVIGLRKRIECILKNSKKSKTCILILGGYKGRSLSGIFDKFSTEFPSAFYLCQESDSDDLPFGIVEITIQSL